MGVRGARSHLCFTDSCVRNTRPTVVGGLVRAGLRGAINCNRSPCARSTGRGVERTYGTPRTSMFLLIKKARAGTAIVSTLLGSCRKIITTSAKRVTARRSNTVRFNKRGILAMPRRSKGVSTTRVRGLIGSFCSSTGCRRVMVPKVMCVSRPARCNALCSERRLTTLDGIYQRGRLPLCMSNTHLTCTLTDPRGSIALASLTRLDSMFCVKKAGYKTLFKRTIIVPRGKQVPRFFAVVGRRKTLLTGKEVTKVRFNRLFASELCRHVKGPTVRTTRRVGTTLGGCKCRLSLSAPAGRVFYVISGSMVGGVTRSIRFKF